MLGYSPSEIKEACGNNLLNLIYAPDREAFKHAIETGLKLGDKSQTECRLTKKTEALYPSALYTIWQRAARFALPPRI